ncbi:MAG: nicotinate-nucleotide adenylyltransferase [Proteobacteria bacterium]|nr:nicotinate-nucleotide adenylyltransferase [Pseudomonadota bacterium]
MIGIFGGTFDPIHYGHIKPALSIRHALDLSELRFIPNRIPPHREQPWLSAEQRLALLQTAVQEYPEIVIDQRELNRDGPSYMVDTLKSLQRDFPGETFCLIIGMDALYGISSWHRWKSLFDLCHLVVTTRPGFDKDTVARHMTDEDYRFIEQKMTDDAADLVAMTGGVEGKILLKSVPQLDISSTMIRQQLSQDDLTRGRSPCEPVKQWMPQAAYQQLMSYTKE